jgi:hypothetical protein
VKRTWIAAAIGAVPAVLLLAAACSSGGVEPAAASQQSGMQSYLTCLGEHGVNVPTNSARPSGSARPTGSFSPRPSGSGGPRFGAGGGGFGGFFGTQAPAGVDQATWDAALQACSSLRPTANPSGGPNGGRGGGQDSATRAYVNCLSEHGVTQPGQLANTADPTVAAALSTCAPLRPAPTPSPT